MCDNDSLFEAATAARDWKRAAENWQARYEAAASGSLVLEFAKAIQHGDARHRAWLLESANAFVLNEPLPLRPSRPTEGE